MSFKERRERLRNSPAIVWSDASRMRQQEDTNKLAEELSNNGFEIVYSEIDYLIAGDKQRKLVAVASMPGYNDGILWRCGSIFGAAEIDHSKISEKDHFERISSGSKYHRLIESYVQRPTNFWLSLDDGIFDEIRKLEKIGYKFVSWKDPNLFLRTIDQDDLPRWVKEFWKVK